jgi:hypothetical protein
LQPRQSGTQWQEYALRTSLAPTRLLADAAIAVLDGVRSDRFAASDAPPGVARATPSTRCTIATVPAASESTLEAALVLAGGGEARRGDGEARRGAG